MFGLGFIQGMITHASEVLGQFVGLIFSVVELLLQMGLIYIGICRAFDRPINYRLMFTTFNTSIALKIIGVYLLKFLIFLIPAILIGAGVFIAQMEQVMIIGYLLGLVGIIAAIYLSIRLYLTIGFILDQNSGPVDAIKQSFQATRHNVINLIGLMLLQILIFIVAAIPLGIGFIWAIPLGLIIYGTVYKRLSSR